MTRGCCHGRAVLAAVTLAMVGCRGETPPPYPTWHAKQKPYIPQSDSQNAFDAYALAALDVEREGDKYLERVFFTPGRKAAVLEITAGPIRRIAAAQRNESRFEFVPREPFDAAPFQRGWRLIGRSLVWRIEQNCAKGQFDPAITDAIVGTRFGFDLTAGGATDCYLGLETVNEIRRAIAPHLRSMGAAQLQRLSAGIKGALLKKPPLSRMIENEKGNMLLAVQHVQDAYASNTLDTLRAPLGPDIRDAITYLKNLKKDDAQERPGFFQGFATEAEEYNRWLLSLSEQPLIQRKTDDGPNLVEERPWRRFSRAFFTAPVPLLDVNTTADARTKLLILHAEVLRQIKVYKRVPKTMAEFTQGLTVDPHTGQPFVYSASGQSFALYSVGTDFQDNGGETNETYSSPDLLLERPKD